MYAALGSQREIAFRITALSRCDIVQPPTPPPISIGYRLHRVRLDRQLVDSRVCWRLYLRSGIPQLESGTRHRHRIYWQTKSQREAAEAAPFETSDGNQDISR